MNLIQKLSIVYALMFFAIAGMAYVPAFIDDSGMFMSLFTLDFHDNLLHALSGTWALVAGLVSFTQAKRFFQIFGSLYFFDGAVGLFLGNAYLDLGLFLHGVANYSWTIKFMANLPHLVIGGSAIVIGFYLAKRYEATSART